ncbi:MAG: replication initiator protein A [Lachnospiraceae bacterium]|nr:replication initiator protein A [Lachnospiraceae bacterium]
MEIASKMNSEYFYNSDADQFNFIKIPKLLVTGEDFSSISIPAKILYGMLLDRMAIAMKNKWIDEDGRIYILCQLSEIQEDMNISRRKACDSLQELVNKGLVQKYQSGNGKPTRIYVKNFAKRL